MSSASAKNQHETKMSSPSKSKKPSVVSGQLKKQIEKKRKNAYKKAKPERGIVFIKNIPNGFFEEQIKQYFEQFGRVTRVRLVRSKKTGNDKGFAYIEFVYPEVAEEASKSINNYLMFNKIVKSAYIPPEEQKYNYFRTNLKAVKNTVGKIKYVSNLSRRQIKHVKRVNDWNPESYLKRLSRGNKKLQKIKSSMDTLGLDPDFVSNIIPQLDKLEKVLKDKTKEIAGNELSPISEKGTSDENNSLANTEGEDDTSSSPKPGNVLLIKKRPSSSEKSSKETAKKKKTLKLKDLLESTIKYDSSSDEDFIPSQENSNDDVSNDTSNSFNENESEQSPHSEDKSVRRTKNILKLPKTDNIDKLSKVIKRNQYSGAVHKLPKKKTTKVGNKKQELKKVAAKEIVKQGIAQHIQKKTKKGKAKV